MAINEYAQGKLVQASVAFTNAAGAAADPTTVTCKIKNPAGTVTTYVYGTDPELVRSGTGAYYVDVSVDAPGTWWYRFEGTGNVETAGEWRFLGKVSRFD